MLCKLSLKGLILEKKKKSYVKHTYTWFSTFVQFKSQLEELAVNTVSEVYELFIQVSVLLEFHEPIIRGA